MNAQNLAKRAYSAPGQPTRSARATEYDLFATVTHRLVAASRLGRTGFAALARALHENRRLWTALAADVADGDNRLPAALRAQIFYLAEFTQAHSRQVLAGAAKPEVLIEINTSVMRGLRHDGDKS